MENATIEPDGSSRLLVGADEYQNDARRNIENFAGTARVPVGLTDPLPINGDFARGTFRIPLATTEGTLVASVCRGTKILSKAGGVTTRILRPAVIQRAPVFRCADVDAALILARGLEQDWSWLIPVAAAATTHGSLCGVRPIVMGRDVHVRVELAPGDAAGQNMVSIVAQRVVAAISERYSGIDRIWMEGGLGGEKMASPLNGLLGRGVAVLATADIPGELLTAITRATGADLVEFFTVFTNAVLAAGAQYSHASLTNVIPALYIATGQDVASLPESCRAFNQLTYDAATDVLRWELTCPNLVLGTVGGGTGLPTQHECLNLIGCAGPGMATKLAEVCAATALANEISFWAAICANEWVDAHRQLRSR